MNKHLLMQRKSFVKDGVEIVRSWAFYVHFSIKDHHTDPTNNKIYVIYKLDQNAKRGVGIGFQRTVGEHVHRWVS